MTRVEPPAHLGERDALVSWLAYHRATVRVKCEGLSDEQMRLRSVPPATLSPLGMVRHLAEVEAFWWREVVEGEPVQVYCDEANRDADFDFPPDASVEEAWSRWEAEVAHAEAVFATKELDDEVVERGTANTVRWIMIHLIEEYARHNGHLDLLRQCIDGAVGE